MPNVYHYHPDTGVYLGLSVAKESPLEPGVYLTPANATTEAPPDFAAGEYAAFIDGVWTVHAIPPEPEPEPEPEPLPPTLLAIYALEAAVTPRRMREAVMGVDNGWLADVNNQIIALRAQLT